MLGNFVKHLYMVLLHIFIYGKSSKQQHFKCEEVFMRGVGGGGADARVVVGSRAGSE